MKRLSLVIAIAVAALGGANAAELPTLRHTRAAPQRTCTIGGMTGYLIPGTETCIKVGGYISGEVGVGNLRH
jgi:hypothetical protein